MQQSEFKPQESIGFLIRQAGRALRIKVHHEIKEKGCGLTMEQGGVLMRLSMQDGINQGELACFLGKDKTTVARLLDGMEKNSLIVRVSSKEDKRNKEIYITQKGREMQEIIKSCVMKAQSISLFNLSKEEIESAKEVLQKMIVNLGQFDNDCGLCEE